MQVFLIRHAAAVDETLVLRDPHRHLTPHGRTQARSLGDRLRWHDCTPTYVWSSPLVRAIQTAELVIAGIGGTIAVEVDMDLAPDGSARELVAKLGHVAPDAHVLLVGHEPSLSGIGGLLVGDYFKALDKSEAVRIDHGKLRWRFAWNAEAPALFK
ncbi:MAG: histidine phosphatase family protein [Deltaproteobacteria bacterium]|nr:histidine phosphatase family protein [Deltaproteobacteria bacterium]